MDKLLEEIKDCKVCLPYLEYGVNPVIVASLRSKIVVIGQAPGRIVHNTGIPWNDKSGDNLRAWLGVDKATFYNDNIFALMPMGFCYPGKGKSGDLPPRKECAPLWHSSLLKMMKEKELTLLIGQYAQNYYLKDRVKATLTETVRCFAEYLPEYLPLPHPSPRNNIWQAKNKWFGEEVLPFLKERVGEVTGK
ncbi:uracil-DNA glycosylase family protein [Taibaiella lutea]|uniref:Uracil-DNA glycosylase family protein n=1 Tax=Taibaiella lutea TaxID=2608001 RepID=A0A5M6CHC5_9BACT|nr:uracil-DNA glycosylase family protein [Taibaiella lutea]KAA5532539.1 uracil-DNA glycosylase family protein [Taibaiella lutea]